MNRPAIIMWLGREWQNTEIEVLSWLEIDLPRTIQRDNGRGQLWQFVLAGSCCEMPVYMQDEFGPPVERAL